MRDGEITKAELLYEIMGIRFLFIRPFTSIKLLLWFLGHGFALRIVVLVHIARRWFEINEKRG